MQNFLHRFFMRRGKVPYSQKGKILHSLNLSKYFFLNQFCPFLFLSRSFLFSLIFSEFGQSALTVWELNLSMRGFSFSPSFSSFTVASALANLNALTKGKCLKYGEIKGFEGKWDSRKEWGIPSALRSVIWVISVILTKWKKQKDWGHSKRK